MSDLDRQRRRADLHPRFSDEPVSDETIRLVLAAARPPAGSPVPVVRVRPGSAIGAGDAGVSGAPVVLEILPAPGGGAASCDLVAAQIARAAEEIGLASRLLPSDGVHSPVLLLAVGHPDPRGPGLSDDQGDDGSQARGVAHSDGGTGDTSGVLISFLEIASASAAAEDLDRLLAAIAAELARLFPVDRADIGLLDDTSITAVTVTGRTAESRGRIAGRFARDESHHLGYVTSRGEALWRNDVANELRFRETLPRAGARSDMTIPLRSRGRVIGALRVASRRRHAYEPEEFDLFQRLADLLAVAVENQRLLETTRRMAEIDGLTGACNHRHFSVLLAKEAARTATTGVPLALVMVDIDHFKRVNDNHGHPAGDAALRHVVGLLVRRVRRSDVVARYGGEEFAVLLPGSDAAAAARLAEGLRADIAGTPLSLEGSGRSLSLTASFGVASVPASAADGRGLVEAADRALYRAKDGGRDRVETAPAAGVDP